MRRVKIVTLILAGASGATLWSQGLEAPFEDWAFITAITLLLSRLRVGLPFFGEASLHFLGALVAAHLFPPAAAGAAAGLGYWGRLDNPWRELFNRSQLFLATAAAASVVETAGQAFWGSLAGAVVYLAVNAAAVAAVFAALQGAPPGRSFYTSLGPYATTYLFLSPVAYLGALLYRTPVLYRDWGGIDLLVLGLPVLYAYSSWQSWNRMNAAVSRAMEAVVRALEAKDPYTALHSERVAAIAESIGQELRLPPEEVALIRQAALLHDIGKVGMRDALLNKPESLSLEEQIAMRAHPEIGRRVLHPLFPFLPQVEEAVLYHHERWDGKGYPSGLKGTQIPLVARILAVADAYEAMTSDRPYRKGLSPEEALAEIQRQAGAQFDPAVVEAFVRAFKRDALWKVRNQFRARTEERPA